MSVRWNTDCADCGKFILSEERDRVCGDIKCVAGRYENGYYDDIEDIFYCKECHEARIQAKD